MFTTDIAVRVNHLYPATDSPSFTEGTSAERLQTIQGHVMGVVSQSSCRVINIRGAESSEIYRMLGVVAARAGWIVLAPQRQAAPLERLIFGAGFRMTESAIAHLAAQTTTIVIDKFDQLRSKQKILSACGSASCRSILITSCEITDRQFSDAGITQYLCIDLSPADAPPRVREVIIDG